MPHTFWLCGSGPGAGSQKGSSSFLWGGSRGTKPKVWNKGGVRERERIIIKSMRSQQRSLLMGDKEEGKASSGRILFLGHGCIELGTLCEGDFGLPVSVEEATDMTICLYNYQSLGLLAFSSSPYFRLPWYTLSHVLSYEGWGASRHSGASAENQRKTNPSGRSEFVGTTWIQSLLREVACTQIIKGHSETRLG